MTATMFHLYRGNKALAGPGHLDFQRLGFRQYFGGLVARLI